MFRRCDGEAEAEATPIGWLPATDALDTTGLEMPAADLAELLRVDGPAILLEMPQFEEHYARFGAQLPPELAEQLATMKDALGA